MEPKNEKIEFDSLFKDAAELAVNNQQINVSFIQRQLKLGYNRACRIIDQLEAAGIIGKQKGTSPREALVKDYIQLKKILNDLKID